MSFGCLSYRNGKYQGLLNGALQRHGLGVMIDDDLTFHVSHWQEDRMQGATLVYLAHAKYIYGEWKNNEPHGLNVYRSGDTVLLSKYVFGVPSHRCLLIFERHGFGCVLGEHNKQWQVIKSGLLVNHSALMKLIELLQVDVPEHYLSLIKFACAFSHAHSHPALRTFPCHQNHCYFGYVNGLAIVFNSNNGLVTVGQHRNEELCEFGGKFISKKAAEEGNFAPGGETVQYRGERPSPRIHQVYQKLHKRDGNFVNEAFESKTKVFSSIQSLIINKLKQIVEESRKSEDIARFDLNESLDYHEHDDYESLRLDELRDKMYSPPKKTFERTLQTFTPVKVEPMAHNQSLLKKSIKKIISGQTASSNAKQQKQIKSYTPSKAERAQRPSEFTEEVMEGKRSKGREQSAQLFEKCNAIYTNTINKRIEESSRSLNEIFPLQHDKFKGLLHDKQQSNRLEETSSFKRILEEEAEQQKKATFNLIKKSSKCQPTLEVERREEDQAPRQRCAYKRREKSIEQFARPTYQDIEERRKRILRDFQELNSGQVDITPKREKAAVPDSPYKEHLISVDREDQSSFGYVPLSLSTKINQKREAAKPKDKHAQLQSAQEDRPHSSTRRANYNYSGLDSRALPSQNRQPSTSQASQQQGSVTPVRQKRTYQYMYE